MIVIDICGKRFPFLGVGDDIRVLLRAVALLRPESDGDAGIASRHGEHIVIVAVLMIPDHLDIVVVGIFGDETLHDARRHIHADPVAGRHLIIVYTLSIKISDRHGAGARGGDAECKDVADGIGVQGVAIADGIVVFGLVELSVHIISIALAIKVAGPAVVVINHTIECAVLGNARLLGAIPFAEFFMICDLIFATNSAYTIILRVRHVARHAAVTYNSLIITGDAAHEGRGDGVVMFRADIGLHPAVDYFGISS